MKQLGTKGNEQPYTSKDLMKSIYQCNCCNHPLLMFGCENPNCENYYLKNLIKKEEENERNID